ncbi:hypothetical protein AYH43_005521, partial [Escherichia coli]|nr:hypothetical protein [Escherichia coli]
NGVILTPTILNFLERYENMYKDLINPTISLEIMSNNKYKPSVARHKRIFSQPILTLGGIISSNDLSSYEMIVALFLIKNNIDFHFQFRTEESIEFMGNRRYDFYVPDYNLIIEVDGAQHTNYCPIFHRSEECLQKQMEIDEIKLEFAKESGYNFARINYDESIVDELINVIKKISSENNQIIRTY